jgi:raffinose/stachyose/melibiose transport system substrate-binding protein
VAACARGQTSIEKRFHWARRATERQMPGTVSRKDFLRLGGVGLAGATLLGAAGCGGSLSGNQVVKFLTNAEETSIQERAAIEIQVDRFEEQHPKYTLEREVIHAGEGTVINTNKEMQTTLQSEDRPDVISYDTGPGFGGVLADAGLVLPLEDAYQQRGWDIYEWAKQRATYNGTLYGVPDQVEEIVLYYNKNLVPEVPKTLEELRQIADGLRGRGIIPFAFGNQEQWPAGHMFSIGVSNVLGREGLDDIFYADGRWDTPEVEEAIYLFFREFVESGYYPAGLSALTYDGANALFYTGEAAMNPTGTWLVSEIVQTGQDFEVGFFPFPSIEGSGISPPAGVGAGLFVANKASNPQGAIDFIDYLLDESTARLIIEKLNVIPAQPINPKGLDVPELFKEVLEDLSTTAEAKSFGYNIDVLAPQTFNQVMFTGFEEVLEGTRSPAEQSAALQDAWATAKKQGKIATQG